MKDIRKWVSFVLIGMGFQDFFIDSCFLPLSLLQFVSFLQTLHQKRQLVSIPSIDAVENSDIFIKMRNLFSAQLVTILAAA